MQKKKVINYGIEEWCRNTELKNGKQEGEKSQKIAIAKKLLERGTTIKEISEITDLEVEEIEKIKELVDKK